MMSAGWNPWGAGLGSYGRDHPRVQCKDGDFWFIDPNRRTEVP